MFRSQSGNILFLILLAVVLFAALAYAVTNSLRGGGQNATREKSDLYAAQWLQTYNLIENTVQREMLVNNVKPWGFDFSGSSGGDSNANGTCTSASCRIFSEKGGSVTLPDRPEWVRDPNATSFYTSFRMVRVLNVGTDDPELVVITWGLRKEICEAFNRANGHADIDLSLKQESWTWTAPYIYTSTLTDLPSGYAIIGDQMAVLKGKKSFCFLHNGNPTEGYPLVHVLMER